jgi:hypothetical protein
MALTVNDSRAGVRQPGEPSSVGGRAMNASKQLAVQAPPGDSYSGQPAGLRRRARSATLGSINSCGACFELYFMNRPFRLENLLHFRR